METFTSFKEWLISHEGIAPDRAKVIASNLRFAQDNLTHTVSYKDKKNAINSLYSVLQDANRFSGETLQEKIHEFITEVDRLYRYLLVDYEIFGTYDGAISDKKLSEVKTALIKYIQFLSSRFECLRLEDVQKELLKRDTDSKVLHNLAKWNPEEKLSKKSGKIIRWLGWKFHNMGLSAIFRKFGASVLPQGDEEFVQIPMAQFRKFMEAYGELYKAGNLSDIYKGCSFITDDTSDFTGVLWFDDVIGQSIHLFAGEKELNFKDIKSLKADMDSGNLIVDSNKYGCISIRLPIISGRKPRYRKLSFKTTVNMPIVDQAGLLSEIRKECATLQECLNEFDITYEYDEQEFYKVIELVDVGKTVKAADQAYTLLRHFASLLRIDLVIE